MQNKGFNESYVNTLSMPIWKLICFYNSKQSDMLNLLFQKHFRKRDTFFSKGCTLFIFSSEFEAALFTMAGQICSDLSIKINAMLLIISLSFEVCFIEGKKISKTVNRV